MPIIVRCEQLRAHLLIQDYWIIRQHSFARNAARQVRRWVSGRGIVSQEAVNRRDFERNVGGVIKSGESLSDLMVVDSESFKGLYAEHVHYVETLKCLVLHRGIDSLVNTPKY